MKTKILTSQRVNGKQAVFISFLNGNKSSQKIGEIYHDRLPKVFLTWRNKDHIFHKFDNGFGESEELLDILQGNDVEIIIVNYEDKETYTTTINQFLVNGEDYIDTSNGVEDKQIILRGKYWKKGLLTYKQQRIGEVYD